MKYFAVIDSSYYLPIPLGDDSHQIQEEGKEANPRGKARFRHHRSGTLPEVPLWPY